MDEEDKVNKKGAFHCGTPPGCGVLTNQGKLDLSYEIETGSQGVGTRSPVCGANLVAILVYKFCGTELAKGFRSAAANAITLLGMETGTGLDNIRQPGDTLDLRLYCL